MLSVIEGVNGYVTDVGVLLDAGTIPFLSRVPTGRLFAPVNEIDLVDVKVGPGFEPVTFRNTLTPSRTEAIENPPRITV